MYLKKTPNAHGRIRLSIVDTYYDKTKKCSRQKTVESIGWLDELEKQYDDPIAYFTKRVAELNKEKQEKQAPIHFTFYDSFHCRPAANDPAKAQTSWAAPTFASSVGPSNAPPDGRKKAPRLRGFL